MFRSFFMKIKLFSALLVGTALMLPFQTVYAQSPNIVVESVQTDVDYGKYDSFLIKPLDISDVRLIPPPWAEGKAGKPRDWKISTKNAAFLQSQYQSAMHKELSGGYKLAAEADANVLEFEVEIISLTPYASPKDKVITKGSGEMTLRAEVRDSMTGDLLVLFEGDTVVGEGYQEHTEFTVDQNLEALFSAWGAYLRDALTEAQAEAQR
jgi:hypothetical protein